MSVDFWTDTVPQICRTEPAVWDAMIAISALFEYPNQCMDFTLLRNNSNRIVPLNQVQQDALTWYSRSISSVHSQIGRGSADPYIAMISCTLFICIETIQGRMEEAFQLYKQGVALILELRKQVNRGVVSLSKANLLEHTIIPLFLRLGVISFTISGTQPTDIFSLAETEIGSGFVSVESARSAMTSIAAEIMLFEREAAAHLKSVGGEPFVSPEVTLKKDSLSARLLGWYQAYIRFCEISQLHNGFSITPEPILLTFYAAGRITLTGCLSQQETAYDVHIADFTAIVEGASSVLNAMTSPDGVLPPFTFEMGVGIPLFLTALRCREPTIRRKALDLLKKAPPMQAFFKCTPTALLAENLMNLEEAFSHKMTATTKPALCSFGNIEKDNAGNLLWSHLEIPTQQILMPEEARICFYGVFRPQDWIPPGITEEDVVKYCRSPGQLFLVFARNQFDENSQLWQPVHQCIPLEGSL